jgi:hypothetical protein
MVGTPPAAKATASPSRKSSREKTPRRVRSTSRGLSAIRGGEARDIVMREIVWESSSGGGGDIVSWPMLTKINYTEWAILMRVQLLGTEVWDAAETDDAPKRQALGAILCSVPPEMVQVLAAKDNVKAAWNTIKTMRVGMDRRGARSCARTST